MQLFYEIRSTLTTKDGAALTLTPVKWYRYEEVPTEEDPDAVRVVVSDPSDPLAEPDADNGKLTELRIEGSADPWVPGDYLTIDVALSRIDVS